MPCEILIRGATDYVHPDPEKDRSGVYKKGYPVSMKDYPHSGWGYKEGYPKFVQLRVTDGNVADVETLISNNFGGNSLVQSWKRHVDFSVVNSNLTLDGWRIKITVLNPGSTNLAGITRSMVENYLNNWNASIHSTASNEVVFDISVFEAIKSEKFWDSKVSKVSFNELSYDSNTGVHRIKVDYSNTNVEYKDVKQKVLQRSGTIFNNVGESITFEISRTNVLEWFQKELSDTFRNDVYCRQFVFPETAVDTIISTGIKTTVSHQKGDRDYYTLEVTLAQLQAYIINRVDENL